MFDLDWDSQVRGGWFLSGLGGGGLGGWGAGGLLRRAPQLWSAGSLTLQESGSASLKWQQSSQRARDQAQYTEAFQAPTWVVFADVPLSKTGQVPSSDASGKTDFTSLRAEWTTAGILYSF